MKRITAKFPGTCRQCGLPIEVGTEILWERGAGAQHAECPQLPEGTIRLSGGSGYGCDGWEPGQVVARTENGERRYYTVLHATERYIREDGMSFGVGDEAGYIFKAVARPATDEESAELRREFEMTERRKAAREQIRSIGRHIRRNGVRPDERRDEPRGERLLDTQDMYGGGSWFVIEATERIWYILNNGSDGADWSQNNITTGGAGAIGWYIPYDAEVAQNLRTSVAEVNEANAHLCK